MALSAAERQRRYRQRRDANPVRRESYLQKEKEKYSKDKENGKKKTVKDITEREIRAARKKWRKVKRQRKLQIKVLENMQTPPSSPLEGNHQDDRSTSRQKAEGNRVIKRNRQRMKREIDRLKRKLDDEKNNTQLLKRRLSRLTDKSRNVSSPRTKANRLIKCFTPKSRKNADNRQRIRKTLTFHYALMEELKRSKKESKKSMITVVAGSILRKYKFRIHTQRELGIYGGRVVKTDRKCVTVNEMEKVKKFYERSDISRVTTGIRSTITRRKEKRQKRLLTDTLTNLHKQYKLEENSKLSFSTFYRLKPFWIVSPRESDRDTCLCKLCENVRLTSKCLFNLKLLKSCERNDLISHVVCDASSKDCTYRSCCTCKDRELLVSKEKANDTIEWKYWVTEEKTIVQNGKEKTISNVVKQNRVTRVHELVDVFHNDMQRFAKHWYNITSQNRYYMTLKNSLSEKEALICIDFSENYTGKMAQEIQSMHFGASKPQITLHTGIHYIGKSKARTFTTVSDSLEHGPAGVWGHLKPILLNIKSDSPAVNMIHVFSDGPVTQYKQKGNFYLFSTELHKIGLKGTWNFHEAGHGRGIPDGVGAAVKRTANRIVLHGEDIMSASEFVRKVQTRTKVNLIEVSQEEINTFSQCLKSQELKPVQGTLKIHQIRTEVTGETKVRDVSCMCKGSGCCSVENPVNTAYFNDYKVKEKVSKSKPPKQTRENSNTNKSSQDLYKRYLRDYY